MHRQCENRSRLPLSSSRFGLFLFSLVAFVAPLMAQASADKDDDARDILHIETTVTATRTEVDVFDVPMSVSVIEDIDEHPVDNPAELLALEPGVDLNGVGPNQVRPVIRGQRGLRILFLEDGLSINNPRRQADFGEITGLSDLDGVAKVEVVRGPASVLYGSGAIGGVINLVPTGTTFSAPVAYRGGLDVRASSADEQEKLGGWLAGSGPTFAFSLRGSTRDAENYDAPSGSFGAIRLDGATEVIDSGVEDDTVSGRLGWQWNERQSLTFRGHRYRADQFGFGFVDPELIDPAFNGTQTRILYPFQDFDRYVLHWSGGGYTGTALNTFDVRIFDQSNERELAFLGDINIGPIFPGAPSSGITIDTLNFTDVDTRGVRAEATRRAGERNFLTAGVEWGEDDSRNTDRSDQVTTFRFPFPPSVIGEIPGFTCIDFAPPFECSFSDTDTVANTPNARNTSYGLFVQDEFAVTDRLQLILGVRYQNVETRAVNTPGLDTQGLDFDDDQVVGALNVLWQLNDSFELVGSVGTAFRAPSIIERLFNGVTPEGFGYQILNPSLESETSDYFDFGFKYRNRRGWAEAVYFENQIDNGIVQDFLSPAEIAGLPAVTRQAIAQAGASFVVQQRNVDRVRFEGVEVSGGWSFAKSWSVGGSYTHLNSERIDADNPPSGDVPEDKGSLWARYERPRWSVEYRLRHNEDRRAVFEAGDPVPLAGPTLPSFTLHEIAAFTTLVSNDRQEHRLGLVIENLTDELYAEFTNIGAFRPQPERNFVVTYRLGLR